VTVSSTPTHTAGHVGTDRAERFLARHPALVVLGRFGWVAKGIVYALVGFLALSIALGSDSEGASGDGGGAEASQSGAIARIADASFGAVTSSSWRRAY
jgi:Domain of Unknown Function (DUF1206)